MKIASFLNRDRIVLDATIRDKRSLLRELGQRAAAGLGLGPDTVIAALQAREQLGSTGLGKGFALPHARLEGLDDYFGLLLRLTRPIDFDAIDGQPVDLVFLLLMPQDPGQRHVAALAAISRRMRDAAIVERIRRAAGAEEVLTALTDDAEAAS